MKIHGAGPIRARIWAVFRGKQSILAYKLDRLDSIHMLSPYIDSHDTYLCFFIYLASLTETIYPDFDVWVQFLRI